MSKFSTISPSMCHLTPYTGARATSHDASMNVGNAPLLYKFVYSGL